MSALLPTARFTGSLLPARNPFSSNPKRNTSGTSLFRPTELFMSPPVTKDRSSPSGPTAKASFSTPATKRTFAFWLLTQKEISSPAPNPAAASFASRGVRRRHRPKTPRMQPWRKRKASCSMKLPSAKSLPSLWPPTAPSTSPPSVRSNALGKLRARSSPTHKARQPL